jgi:outer membrane protein assembly factor BamB
VPGLPRPPLRVLVWTAVTVALLVVAALLWRGSDAAATQSTTAAPADVPTGTPAGAVSRAWSADGRLIPDTVVQEGVVLVGSTHGVRALDVTTGREAWHYTRSNARMCGLTATDGVAVAVFATANRCDEAVALVADTGVRKWTRSVNFVPDVRLSSTEGIVLASSPGGFVVLDPVGDGERWHHTAPGACRILGAQAGDAGIAVLEHCAGADGVQLRLFGGYAGEKHWNLDIAVPEAEASEARLLGADGVVTVIVGGELQVRSAANGTILSRQPAGGRVEQRSAGGVPFLLVDGELRALDPATGAVRWTTPAIGLPTAAAEDAGKPASVLVPEADAFVRRNPATGAELGRSAAAGVPEGGAASFLGPVVVYRLDDRVLAYR